MQNGITGYVLSCLGAKNESYCGIVALRIPRSIMPLTSLTNDDGTGLNGSFKLMRGCPFMPSIIPYRLEGGNQQS